MGIVIGSCVAEETTNVNTNGENSDASDRSTSLGMTESSTATVEHGTATAVLDALRAGQNHVRPALFVPDLTQVRQHRMRRLLYGIKCPVCSKFVMPDDIECHLVMCLTKPRLSYNEDVLAEDKGECVICLEELLHGQTIARLPCLCVYHKNCIDNWFEVNRSCPEHPSD